MRGFFIYVKENAILSSSCIVIYFRTHFNITLSIFDFSKGFVPLPECGRKGGSEMCTSCMVSRRSDLPNVFLIKTLGGSSLMLLVPSD